VASSIFIEASLAFVVVSALFALESLAPGFGFTILTPAQKLKISRIA